MDEQEILISLENLDEYHRGLLEQLPSEQVWIGNGDPSGNDEVTDGQIFGVDVQNGEFYYRLSEGGAWNQFSLGDKNKFMSNITTEVFYKNEKISTTKDPDSNIDISEKQIFISPDDKECKLKFKWFCAIFEDTSEDEGENGNDQNGGNAENRVKTRGTININVDGITKETFKMYSSTDKEYIVEKDLRKYIKEGNNIVEFVVSDSYGSTRVFKITISLIVLSISTSLESTPIFQQGDKDGNPEEGDIRRTFSVKGVGGKKLHVIINGIERRTISVQASSETVQYPLVDFPRYELTINENGEYEEDPSQRCHGAYFAEVYATSTEATDAENIIKSNSLYFDIIWIDNTESGNGKPKIILASPFKMEEVLQHERFDIPYYIYRKDGGSFGNIRTYMEYTDSNGIDRTEGDSENSQKKSINTLLSWKTNFSGDIRKGETQKVDFYIELWNDNDNELLATKKITIIVNYRDVPKIEPFNERLGINFIPHNTNINDDPDKRDDWISNGECKDLQADFSPEITINGNTEKKSFDWTTGGWKIEDNRNCLKITNKSWLKIPYAIFAQAPINHAQTTFRSEGFTLEVDVSFSNVVDYNEPFFTCFEDGKGITISPSQATITDGVNSATTYYESSKSKRYSNSMHFTFVISRQEEQQQKIKDSEGNEKIVTKYLGGMYIYINGVGAAAQVYNAPDNNTTTPTNQFSHDGFVYLNSDSCDLNLFGLRMYYTQLSQKQIVDNWISDMEPVNKIEANKENNILVSINNRWDISYALVKDKLPHMIITGDLPRYKGDKVGVNVKFVDPKEAARCFELKHFDSDGKPDGAQMDVQGTSSQYYPVKNWKIKKKKANFIIDTEEEPAEKYAISEGQIPSSVFCLKADYMETSSTHNTVTALLANSIYDKTDNGRTPPQRKDNSVRTTIYGRPILVFYADPRKPDEAPIFGGKYNFNYDKDSEEVFGFIPPEQDSLEYKNDFELIECVEFKENTEKKALIQQKMIDSNNPDNTKDTDGFDDQGIYKALDQAWIDVADASSYDDREILKTTTINGINKSLIPYWAKAFEFRAYNRNPIYKGNDANYDVEDDKKPNNENTTHYRRAYLEAVTNWVNDLDAKSAPNTKLNKQMEFDKGAAQYEYDLDMQKVSFKHTKDGLDGTANRFSLDLGTKIPEELDYSIETYYGIQYLKQKQNEDGSITEKEILDPPKIWSKEDWERSILGKAGTDVANNFLESYDKIKIGYVLNYIDKTIEDDENNSIYRELYFKEDWDSFSKALEAPEEVQYKIYRYIVLINTQTNEEETYIEQDYINKQQDPEWMKNRTELRRYYKIFLISPILGTSIKEEEYQDSQWEKLGDKSVDNVFVEVEKFYTIQENWTGKHLLDSWDNEKNIFQTQWDELMLDPTKIFLEIKNGEIQYKDEEGYIDLKLSDIEKEKIKTAIEEISPGQDFVQKVRIYYALPWDLDEEEKNYSNGKEVYRYNKDSRNYRLSRFKSEFEEHFNTHFCLMYFLLMELLGMIDSSTKNMFWATWGERHEKHSELNISETEKDYNVIWYPIFYDMDSILGIDNVGKMEIPYNVEYDTVLSNDEHAYNGYGNVFWENFRASFVTELGDTFRQKISEGVFDQQRILDLYNNHSFNYPETIYNRDGELKLLDTYFTGYEVGIGKDEDGNIIKETRYADWLHIYQGDRYYHRNFWFPNRFNYICSKNRAGKYVDDYISMRLNDPSRSSNTPLAVEPNYDFEIETWKDQYVRVKYGGFSVAKRFFANTPDTIKSPQSTYNDTETAIYGASNIKSIGKLASKYANSIKLDSATRLVEFDAGSDSQGYRNQALERISFGTNSMLKRVNLNNCSSLNTDLILSGCENLEEVSLKNTQIKNVYFSEPGRLREVFLPNTIQSLYLRNQNSLSQFEMANTGTGTYTVRDRNTGETVEKDRNIYGSLQKIIVTNVPFLNKNRQDQEATITSPSEQFVRGSIDQSLNTLELTGIEWVLEDESLLLSIMEKGKSGKLTNSNQGPPTLHGKCTIKSIPRPLIDQFNMYFNEVNSVGDLVDIENRKFQLYVSDEDIIEAVTVKFYNTTEEGEESPLNSGISGDYVIFGKEINYDYINNLPTREKKWDRTFTFIGWKEKFSDGTYSDDVYVKEISSPEDKKLPKATYDVEYVAVYNTNYRNFYFEFYDTSDSNIGIIGPRNTVKEQEFDIDFTEKKLDNIINEYGDNDPNAFGRYFLGWQIKKGDDTVRTVYKDRKLKFNKQLWYDYFSKNDGSVPAYVYDLEEIRFICKPTYTLDEQLCLVTFKDEQNMYLKTKDGKDYKRIPHFVEGKFGSGDNTFIRESTFEVPVPQQETSLFSYEDETINSIYYFKEWAAKRNFGKYTIITRKEFKEEAEEYEKITQLLDTVTFNDDENHITSGLVNNNDGYELVFTPQYVERIGKYTIYYHIIHGGLEEDAEYYIDGEDFNEDFYKDFVIENVSYRSDNFNVPNLEEDVKGKMYGYKCLGWRKGKTFEDASGKELIKHNNIQTEIWNEVYEENEIHYWVDYEKKKYTIIINYNISADSGEPKGESLESEEITFGDYLYITQDQVTTLKTKYSTRKETGTFLNWKWTDLYDNVEKTATEVSSIRITGKLVIDTVYDITTRWYTVTWVFNDSYSVPKDFEYEQTITPPTSNPFIYGATYDDRVFLGFDSNYKENGKYLNKPCTEDGIIIYATTKGLEGKTKTLYYNSEGCNGTETLNVDSTTYNSFTVKPAITTWHSRKLKIDTTKIFGDGKKRTIQYIKVKYNTSGNIDNWLIAEHMFLGQSSDYAFSPNIMAEPKVGGFGTNKSITYSLNSDTKKALMNSDGQQYIWFGYYEFSAETPTVEITGISFEIQFHQPD